MARPKKIKEEEQIKIMMEDRPVRSDKPTPKIDVEKFYYVIRDEWLKDVDMSTCINCGRKDYHAHELVRLKNHDKMGLVCFDCLIKNGYWRTYNRIKKIWIWGKFEKKDV